MPKKIRRLNPNKHSKVELMRHVLRALPDLTRREVGEFYGDEEMFSQAHFSTVRQAVRKELGLEPKKKQLQLFKEENKERGNNEKAPVPGKADVPSPPAAMSPLSPPHALPTTAGEVHALLRENAYLRWQLEGERQGFFDRWIEETANAGVNG